MEPKPEDLFNIGSKTEVEAFSFDPELKNRLRHLEQDSALEVKLQQREIVRKNELLGGMNDAIAVQLKDDGSGVLKLESREKVIDSYKKERAAYIVDKFLGFGLVPPTVIREFIGDVGSLQEFIVDTLELHSLMLFKYGDCDTIEQSRNQKLKVFHDYLNDFLKLLIFDYLIHNSDRHDFNFLFKEGRIYAIDNGFTFDDKNQLRLFMPDNLFASSAKYILSPELKMNLNKTLEWGEGKSLLREKFKILLTQKQIDTFFKRLDNLRSIINSKNIITAIYTAR